jgi:hypothetical protein
MMQPVPARSARRIQATHHRLACDRTAPQAALATVQDRPADLPFRALPNQNASPHLSTGYQTSILSK